MARVLWTPNARESLVKIGRYVVEQSQSVDRGVKVIDQIEDKCHLYAGFPGAGTAREDLGIGLHAFRLAISLSSIDRSITAFG